MFLQLTDECLEAAQGRFPAEDHTPGSPKRQRPRSIQVFRNRFVEAVFSRAHPITPIVWFAPLITFGLYKGIVSPAYSWRGVIGLFFAGWLAWTLLEYMLHRFLFHMKAVTPDEKLRLFMVHGYHHEFPQDGLRLVAPPLMSWPVAIVWVTASYFLLGAEYYGPFVAGTTTGYIAYDWIHYYTHHFKPTTRMGKWIRNYHLQHHFDSEHPNARYGVSSPLWDFVFGTYRPVKKANRSSDDQHAGSHTAGSVAG